MSIDNVWKVHKKCTFEKCPIQQLFCTEIVFFYRFFFLLWMASSFSLLFDDFPITHLVWFFFLTIFTPYSWIEKTKWIFSLFFLPSPFDLNLTAGEARNCKYNGMLEMILFLSWIIFTVCVLDFLNTFFSSLGNILFWTSFYRLQFWVTFVEKKNLSHPWTGQYLVQSLVIRSVIWHVVFRSVVASLRLLHANTYKYFVMNSFIDKKKNSWENNFGIILLAGNSNWSCCANCAYCWIAEVNKWMSFVKELQWEIEFSTWNYGNFFNFSDYKQWWLHMVFKLKHLTRYINSTMNRINKSYVQ